MLKRWCGNVYGTSERKQKVVLAAILEGKSMPSNMAAYTNHAALLKNQSIKIPPLNAFPLKFFGCKIIFVFCRFLATARLQLTV